MMKAVPGTKAHYSLAIVLAMAWPSCTFDASAPGASRASDADLAAPDASDNDGAANIDADPGAPDADPAAPDAVPSPDAVPPQPDAVPPPPDAGSGTISFQEGISGYAGTVDNYLTPSAPNTAQGSIASIKWEQDDQEHGLLRFDNIFGLGPRQIPPGASIMAATLTVVVFDFSNGDSDLREAAVDWNEATTYNNFGGDADVQDAEMHSEVIAIVPKALGTHALDVTESVRRWADGSRTNRGWVFDPQDDNDHQVWSSEHGTLAERPLLVVEYFWP